MRRLCVDAAVRCWTMMTRDTVTLDARRPTGTGEGPVLRHCKQSRPSIPAVVADLDFAVTHANRKYGSRFKRRRGHCLASADAETCAVARAHNLVPLDWATCEDAAVVGAVVLDGVVATLQVKDRNPSAVHVHHP